MGEFDIISKDVEYKEIYEYCILSEQSSTNEEKAVNCRETLSQTIKFIYKKECKKYPKSATLLELIEGQVIREFIKNNIILESLHYIRKLGMNAIHGKHITKKQAKVAFNNIVFFIQFVVKKYDTPELLGTIVLPQYMNEEATRAIYIDAYLNEAGWEVLTPDSTTELADGTKRISGIAYPGKACCEIPVEGLTNRSKMGFCDYVLYGKDGKPLAIVEAKRTSIDASEGEEQVKEYGECMSKKYGYIPVLYFTNGYEINIIDGFYPARKVMAFHSLEELEYLIQRRGRGDITNLSIDENITERGYQKMAITRVCEKFNLKFKRSLIVMATGTGKTRVAISLVKVLLQNNWIKNVLFLADRTSLVRQAFHNFSNYLSDMTYCVLSEPSLANEPNARITFSTHQTMIHYIDQEDKEYTCGHFHLIIIDEAHRSIFNKYGAIFEYFDSLIVGLTATPKDKVDQNTYQIFNCENGEPDYSYSLTEAVSETYLVPYRNDCNTTKIMDRGFQYKQLSEEDKLKVDSVLMVEEDEIDEEQSFSKDTIFRDFYNIDTCSRVLDYVLNKGQRVDSGQFIGKTIIFAYNHKHAKMIVDTFKENYPKYGDDYCQLIDNTVKGADDLIKKFGENKDFRIAVSVDMMDTGIDVPSVLNLVFFKPVKSKIKFIQMIGRGTRPCPGLIDGMDKKYFIIFDFCDNFQFFDKCPDGIETKNTKSLSQKLFDLKLDILVELQSYQHQQNAISKAYYDKLKPELFQKAQAIKENSSRISVRQEMPYVDKYNDYDNWSVIAPLAKKEIQLHLSKLVDIDLDQSSKVLQFDMHMLNIELSVIATGTISKATKQVKKVREIAKYLLTYAATQPSVMAQAKTLKILEENEFWTQPSIDRLELYRENVRGLLVYIESGSKPVNININDEIIQADYIGSPLIDIRTYREKVIDYLAEHTDNITIQKIKNLDQIDAEDLKELERILWNELGTPDDYHKETDIDNLAAFIRSIVGVEQEAINEKFGEFLNDNVLNARQQEFVKSIIDYVRENGDIEMEDLVEKSPFDSYNILDLFGGQVVKVKELVEKLHHSILAVYRRKQVWHTKQH